MTVRETVAMAPLRMYGHHCRITPKLMSEPPLATPVEENDHV